MLLLCLFSDKNDAFNSNYSFLSDSQQIGNRLTGIEQQLSLQTTGIAPLRSTILSRLNNGVSVVNYVGHSSLTKFGLQDTILDDVDAFNLTNVNSPFMLNMLGCNSNDYTLPSSSSLGMSFLLGNQSGGAVSVLGQTARVNPFHSTELAKDYYLGLSNGLTQGKALIAAQQAFAEKQGNNLSRRDVLVGTSLLGLPTLTLPQMSLSVPVIQHIPSIFVMLAPTLPNRNNNVSFLASIRFLRSLLWFWFGWAHLINLFTTSMCVFTKLRALLVFWVSTVPTKPQRQSVLTFF